MKLQPARGRILVRPVKPSSKGPSRIGSMENSMGGMMPVAPTVGGVSPGMDESDVVNIGDVVAAGEPDEDYKGNKRPPVNPGDTVYYHKHAGTPVHLNGSKHHFIGHGDVLATRRKKGRK